MEAVTSVARRPHEMYELAVEHSSVPEPSSTPALRMQFSLLAVAALTQAFRVVRSEKMPSASRAAIASYVASVFSHCTNEIKDVLAIPGKADVGLSHVRPKDVCCGTYGHYPMTFFKRTKKCK